MRIDITQPLSEKVLQDPIKYYRTLVDTAFNINMTLDELLHTLRSKNINHEINYFYAIDEDNRLYGVLSTRDILFNPADLHLIDIVEEDIITLHENVTVEHALKVLEDHHFLSVPVVDDEFRLIGLFEIKPVDINFPQRFKKRPSKEIQNVFQMIGFSTEKSKLNSKWTEYRYRMPWLLGNICAGFICAAIAYYFQFTLETVIVLSMFIPLVLTLAESISMQSMTIILQFLHYKKTPWSEIRKRIIHEWFVAAMLGSTCALFLIAYYMIGYDANWYPDLSVFAIACSILISMVVGATLGTVFPLILHELQLDPKVAAGPIVLTITDVMTTAVYLGLATWMLL